MAHSYGKQNLRLTLNLQPLTIFGLINKHSGAGFHRVMVPLLTMRGITPYITNSITPQDFITRKPHAVYYNRVVSDEVLQHARAAGCKVVLDVDDYWLLDAHHIANNVYVQHNFAALQIKHLQQADVVTTTHHRLAEKIAPYNKNVVILPNAIPQHSDYFNTPHIQSDKLRLFWQGSITHERDIALLRNPVKRLNKNNYTMVMGGYTNGEHVWQRMAAMYTNSNRLHSLLLPGVDPTEYYSHYSHADVCLVPLTRTPFNALKSNLKILEAANLCLPVIASHVQPYTGMPGVCYVHNQGDWYKHMQALANETERKQRGQELQQFCARHYNHAMINLKRKECFL